MVAYTLGTYALDHEDDDRGRRARHHRRAHLPARLARDADRGHRAAAVDRSRLSGRSTRAGFSLNLVSLLAITLVTGILVDDAIVEIENIVRHMRMGKSPYRAALEAADEIGLAVIAITLTIIAVFVPVSFMGGIAGQYFKQFGLVVAVRGVLLAAGGAPDHAAAGRLLHARHRVTSDKEGWLLRLYTRLVRWSVAHHYKTVALGLGDLRRPRSAASICCPPASCRPRTAARTLLAVELPPGSRMDDTRAVTDKIARNAARPHRRRTACSSTAAACMGSGAEVRKATLIINLVPKDEAQADARTR